MDNPTGDPSIDEIISESDHLIKEVSNHPAILLDNAIKKKNDTSTIKKDEGVSYSDEFDQIELANKFVADIDDKVRAIYKSVKLKYTLRFPELRIVDPMQYLITVQLLGNKPDRIKDENIRNQLADVLDPKMHLLVTMTASTTQGIKIEPEEMNKILKACAVALHLSNLRTKLLAFVEKNMTIIAPNLSVILGAPIAAKLMGLAGGLKNLANMPSCNIPILGSHKVSNIETDITAPPRVGHIYECDLIQQIPFDHTKDVRKRAVKWVANKCAIAARCDLNKPDPDGKAGRHFRDEIESKINKALEPPPKKAARPLPAPIEKSGKKRGGKRVRKMKERYAQTELRKAVNRITFGDVGDDAYQNDLGFGRSQLQAIQRLRGPQINDKTKIRLSKSAQKKLAKSHQKGFDSQSIAKKADNEQKQAGAAHQLEEKSSIKLKQDQQELQIFNPLAKEVPVASTSGVESSDYFSKTSGFFLLNNK